MESITFDVKSDDALLPALPVQQVAMVKSSGYLVGYGFGEEGIHAAKAYIAENGPRVIVTRIVGEKDWTVYDVPTTDIPDFLSDDYTGI